MKLEYDWAADAAYVKLADAEIVDSEEVRPGVLIMMPRTVSSESRFCTSARRARTSTSAASNWKARRSLAAWESLLLHE